uniref:Uncharacterized protein n=1 Tax=Candidatus Kentrum eta TaxID=2126337 RepID=A0A450UA05_9GAMM|nr:MAG: hypothetical protein BECKH772A_GA0070896_1000247 [Candidatus Kentron sp. H]VFJ88840.1 MAG: hypothetical protein BECKH772B_GA0070898_1000243 [Candidatus Kentron sp. H]VFJ95087.1 MAG: hypothetical protein BECKH772C_GA0070978_1000194 [Candidatus Kentron sp. H]
MNRYLILAQSEVNANAMGMWLELLGEKPLANDDPLRIVWSESIDRTTAIDTYDALCERIEEAARTGTDTIPLNRVTVLADSINLTDLDAVSEGGGWDSLIAMLILGFPEIRWVFGVMTGVEKDHRPEKQNLINQIKLAHSLLSLLSGSRRDPLFDPTGLRDWIRKRTNYELEHTIKDDLRLPERDELAASIEDEKAYAWFHGYAAYRFGYRADVITTWTLMKERFGKEGEKHGYRLLLEDMSLNFPDREAHTHLLRLGSHTDPNDKDKKQGRAHHCPQLDSADDKAETSKCRILITTGQTGYRDAADALKENEAYLQKKKQGRGKIVSKPTSGLFDLWKKRGLLYRVPRNEPCKRPGNALGFFWPPAPPPSKGPRQEDGQPQQEGGHGAPGRLLLIADRLIERAGVLIGKVTSVGEAVQGAVLATDALELTGGRTPATAIEALSLKHRFEVLAECQFSGVGHHIEMEPRMDEIALETESISQWFDKSQRKKAALNGEMHILNELVRLLREHNQFDEERICVGKVRQLYTTLWIRERPCRRCVSWSFIWYVEKLLASFPYFLGAVASWLLIFTVLFTCALPPDVASGISILERIVLGLESAITSFFSIGSPIYHAADADTLPTLPTWPMVWVSSLAIVSGFLHLGILITHLYTLVSRR